MTLVRILSLLAVLTAIGAGALWPGLFKKDDPNIIRLSGNIEITQVDMSFKVPGRIVALNVKEGAAVHKGDVVAQVDQASTLGQKSREQAALDSATAQLVQTRTSIDYQRASIDGDVALKIAELEQAEAHLAELVNGSRPQEVRQARSQVEDGNVLLSQTKRDWDRAQTLYSKDDISTAQYDQARTRYDSAVQSVRQAQERLQMIEEGPRKEVIDAQRAQVDRARAAVQLAEANRIELKRRQQEVAVRHAEIERAKANLAVMDAQLDDTTIASPLDGVVLVKAAEFGEVKAAGATIATIGDLLHPWLRGYIAEKDLGRVKLGTKVRLTSDSYPGKVYWGHVSFIAAEAEFTPKQIQTQDERVKLVYRIKIDAENPDQELKAGMAVDAELVL